MRDGLVCARGCCCPRSSCRGPFVCCSRALIQVVRCQLCLVLADEKGMAVAGTLPSARHHRADSEVGSRHASVSVASKRSAMQASGLRVFYSRVYLCLSCRNRPPKIEARETPHRSKNPGIFKEGPIRFYIDTCSGHEA